MRTYAAGLCSLVLAVVPESRAEVEGYRDDADLPVWAKRCG